MVWLLEIMTASICVDDISRLPILHEFLLPLKAGRFSASPHPGLSLMAAEIASSHHSKDGPAPRGVFLRWIIGLAPRLAQPQRRTAFVLGSTNDAHARSWPRRWPSELPGASTPAFPLVRSHRRSQPFLGRSMARCHRQAWAYRQPGGV